MRKRGRGEERDTTTHLIKNSSFTHASRVTKFSTGPFVVSSAQLCSRYCTVHMEYEKVVASLPSVGRGHPKGQEVSKFLRLVLAREDRLDCKRSAVNFWAIWTLVRVTAGMYLLAPRFSLQPEKPSKASLTWIMHDDRLTELRRTVGEYEHLGLSEVRALLLQSSDLLGLVPTGGT